MEGGSFSPFQAVALSYRCADSSSKCAMVSRLCMAEVPDIVVLARATVTLIRGAEAPIPMFGTIEDSQKVAF
eukprot:2976182-Pyramimonas_sp.AAC.1